MKLEMSLIVFIFQQDTNFIHSSSNYFFIVIWGMEISLMIKSLCEVAIIASLGVRCKWIHEVVSGSRGKPFLYGYAFVRGMLHPGQWCCKEDLCVER